MFGFPRVVVALATILFLGVAAVVALPDVPASERRVGGEWSWTPFRATGGRYKLPPGWRAYDAFTTSTRHSALAVSEPICALSARVALFRGELCDRELFVMYGSHDELDVTVRTIEHSFDSFAAQRGRKQGVVTLADGTEAKWSVTRVALRPGDEYEMSYFVALREDGDQTLVLSGGARTRDFYLDEFLALVSSISTPN